MPRCAAGVLLSVLTLVLAGPVGATPPPPGATAAPETAMPPNAAKAIELPATPAGTTMGRVLGMLADPAKALGAEAFADAFIEQVPYARIEQMMAALNTEHGRFVPVAIEHAEGDRSLVVRAMTEKTGSAWSVMLSVDEQDKIQGLLLRPAAMAAPELADWSAFDERVSELPGSVSFAAYEVQIDAENPEKAPKLVMVHSHARDARLAIGSTFKLYVLGALGEAVAAGTAKWDEKLAINEAHKSLPSGTMQNEAAGSEFALSHFADKMISISDNTATDHLIHRVGRENVEAYMAARHGRPQMNKPFLTTREMFTIKLSSDATLAGRWAAVDEKTRRDMLTPMPGKVLTRPAGMSHNPGEIAEASPDLAAAAEWKKPRDIGTVEWFASAEELCRLMADLASAERRPGMAPLGHAMRINPGMPFDAKRWTGVAFKGGSEPGVLNLTWLLTRDDGKVFAVSFGWNNPEDALDDGKGLGIAAGAVGLLGR